jgi:hypothetical protein
MPPETHGTIRETMASSQIMSPPWPNHDVVVYHGTVDKFASMIVSGPVLVSKGTENTDFGRGFYTTTVKRQARTWADWVSAGANPGAKPAVVEITIDRPTLATLDALAFVRGDFDADDYWSLIHHCRRGASDHGRTGPEPSYDVVYGPLAAFWERRMCVANSDQISFHTPRAEGVLNASARRIV